MRTRASRRITTRKMLNIPFCAYCVPIANHLSRVLDRRLVRILQAMFALMNSTRGTHSGHRLNRPPSEPVDDRPARDETEQERRVE
jgi:hypothetical protein